MSKFEILYFLASESINLKIAFSQLQRKTSDATKIVKTMATIGLDLQINRNCIGGIRSKAKTR